MSIKSVGSVAVEIVAGAGNVEVMRGGFWRDLADDSADALQIATAVLLALHPDVHAEEGDTCWVSHEVITTPERNGWQPVFSVLPWGVDETGRRVPVKSVNINWAGGIFEGDEGIAQARAYAIAILLACALAEEEYRKNTEAMLLKGEQP